MVGTMPDNYGYQIGNDIQGYYYAVSWWQGNDRFNVISMASFETKSEAEVAAFNAMQKKAAIHELSLLTTH